MVKLFESVFLNCDAPGPWGLYSQDNPISQMEALVELHDNIMFYSVIILFGVAWILISIIGNYLWNKVSNKYFNHGTLIELIRTITRTLVLNFPSKLILRISILMFDNPKLLISIIIISVRSICILYDAGGFSETLVVFLDNPGNGSGSGNTDGGNGSGSTGGGNGNTVGGSIEGVAQTTNTYNYIYSYRGRLPWLSRANITPEDMLSAREHVDQGYVDYFKRNLLETGRSLYYPGRGLVSLEDVLTCRNCSNGDAAIIRAYCDSKPIHQIAVVSATGRPGEYFRDL